MNKHFLLTIAIVVCCLAGKITYAQIPIGANPDVKMAGGTSVADGLSGIAAPNLFNGTMNINIPIYSFSDNGNDYGISINYNTQGVKVDEVATRIGLHWNLNCVGSIVRITRDIPDELLAHTDSLIEASYGMYEDSTIFMPNKEMHIYGRLSAYNESPSRLNASNAYGDKECDEFVVSVNGLNFKFYIGKNLKVFTTAPTKMTVQLLSGDVPVTQAGQLTGAQSSELNFMVRDSRGNEYYFTPYSWRAFNGTEFFWDWSHMSGYANMGYQGLQYTCPLGWTLKRIKTAGGKEIIYKHSSNPYTHSVTSGVAYRNYYAEEDNSSGSTVYDYKGRDDQPYDHNMPPLESISYPNNINITFAYDQSHWNARGEMLIHEINVSSGDNCKRFLFYQSELNGREFLDSIIQVSCDGSKTEPYYIFTYNPKTIRFVDQQPGLPPIYDTEYAILPPRLNGGQDLYGYYNGDSTGTSLSSIHYQSSGPAISIPRHHPDIGGIANYGNERAYNAKYAKAGLLTSVRNAYGAEEHFYYGPNVISSVPLSNITPTDNSFIGANQPDGVRIDSIVKTDKADPGHRRLTTFSYSGGQIFMPGGYFHYPEYIDSVTNEWEKVYYQSMFLTPHQLVNGSNHGYSLVTIANYGTDGYQSSRTELTYTNMKDATSDNKARYYKVSGSRDYFQYPYTNKQYLRNWEIGLPLTVIRYDQNNHIIKKVINHYDFSKPIDLSAASYITNTRTVKVNSGTPSSNPGYAEYLSTVLLNQIPVEVYNYKKEITDQYFPFKGFAPLTYSITQKYISDSRFVADTVWFYYDSHNNLTRTATQNSKGEKTETHLVYNYNVDGPASITGLATSHPGTTLYRMTQSGLEVPVSTERWKYTQLIKGNNLLSAFITRYQYQDGKLWTAGLLNTQNGQPIAFNQYAGSPVNGVYVHRYNRILTAYNTTNDVDNYLKTSTVTLFDTKGNPLETRLQDEDQYKAMVWNPATGQKVAEAANCRYSDIAYTSFECNSAEGNLATQSTSHTALFAGAVTGTHTGLLWTQLTPGAAISISGTKNLKAHKEYILSFWVYGATPSVKVGSQVITVSSANLVYTKGSWKNYQVRFTPNAAGKIKITGTAPSSQIDEIRLFPSNAQMQSWTYEPLLGKSSYTDPSGRVTYYRYDKMGRQNLVLDQDGNVLSKTNYQVAQ